ncbi:site-specific DNA-methyltransferase [Thermoanaerobacterium thermosaccharolyticum]|uniref:site-specific DNA-methyltransferase n=1 Tax=Thermoanaerobacterium thermosaccharolyticum TaxID=1517 RepID=UPI000C075612|nr:site-specific DNA-methyltransferase [Thermoanaerobacterium thermosaccharolyticum]
MELKKISQEIYNPVSENVKKLAELFPAAVKDGQVDFEALKQELGQFEEVGKEKYELTWPGKTLAKQLANLDIVGRTLKYVPEDSKNPETTENLYIEGDNLEVLKLLRNSYYGKIKMIYIDPPYNTGNDFVYKDDYSKLKEISDIEEGEVSEDGERLIKNQKSSARFHSNWLNMMYPRLKVAKDLLSDDGVIFISIDDNEVDNLRKICDEIFGEENFVASISNITGASQNGEGVKFQKNKEECLVYVKNQESFFPNKVDKAEENLRNLNDAPTPLITRPDMGYTIYYNEKTNDIIPLMDYDKNKLILNNEEKVYKNNEELIIKGYVPIRPGIKNNQLHRWRWGIETIFRKKK